MTPETDKPEYQSRVSKAINDHEIEWQLEEAKKPTCPKGS
jgi:hypothetical protein